MSRPPLFRVRLASLAALAMTAAPAAAQEGVKRTRVALGPQLGPRYPGARGVVASPLFDLSRAKDDAVFAFEAPDESFGPTLLRREGFAVGPALSLEGSRRARTGDTPVPRVGFAVEAGGFAQYQLTRALRLRVEARRGVTGHGGWVGDLSADRLWRDGDRWLLSLGPRLRLVDDRYARTYFGVAPAPAAARPLPAFRPRGGIGGVGATAGALRQLTPRWGVYGFAQYLRLTGDAARSPLVRSFGSRDQLSGGLALTYTFTRRSRPPAAR